MDGLFCSPSRFMFVSVFRISVSVQHTASPTTGRLMAIIRSLVASAILFWGNSPRNAEARRTQRTAELVLTKKWELSFSATLCGLCSAISRYRRVLRRFFWQGSGTGVSPVCSSKVVACYRNTQARRLCHFAGHVPLVAALPRHVSALKSSGSLTPWRDALRRGLSPGRWPACPSLLPSSPNRC